MSTTITTTKNDEKCVLKGLFKVWPMTFRYPRWVEHLL